MIDKLHKLTKFSALIIIIFYSMSLNINTKELPDNFPPFDILTLDKPAPGIMMFATRGAGYGSYILITDSAANVLNYRPVTSVTSNFSVQPNGLITFNSVQQGYFKAYSEARFYIADTSLTVIDSIVSGNGFIPAPHVSEILPNGHYVYSSFEAHHINMSKVVENGNPNAIVAGAILVEMDIDKNVVFQWRSWDFINIEDTYQPIDDFLNIITLYSNFNSVAIDSDGNYLICNRLLSEITKVNRTTGEIIWRLGGKHNEFTFINENENNAPIYFSMQHDIRILPNGNITLFDNGDQHDPPYSRAVEYEIDDVNKTATLVWEYVPDVRVFATANASTQRLPNGNTIIGWGNTTSNPEKLDITEVNKDSKVEFEMRLPKTINAFKALKFPYPIGKESNKVSRDELLPLNTYKFNNSFDTTGVTIVFQSFEGFMYNWIDVYKYEYAPLYPRFTGKVPNVAPYRYEVNAYSFNNYECEIRFNLDGMINIYNPEKYTIYYRDTNDKKTFIPLVTTYNPQTNELSAKTNVLGEFILAKDYPESKPNPPFLSTPENGKRLENGQVVNFAWSPNGFFRKSSLMVADNPDFENPVFQENELVETRINLNEFDADKTYYWKVKSYNDSFESDWSETFMFALEPGFIEISSPNGGEVWHKDGFRKFVNWDQNVVVPVRIELLLKDEVVIVLDSIESYTGAYAFEIPEHIEPDSNYRVRIVSLNDENLSGISQGYFTIKPDPSSVNEMYEDNSLKFVSIYPIPAQNEVNFEINSEVLENLTICVYDLRGNLVKNVVLNSDNINQNLLNLDCSDLQTGSYIYKLISGNSSKTGKLIIKR
ncbi:MAG: aryl-sulfate sulfotransferase [Candidatus Kapabacteria bacterium]|nr:aryl-sulfate sulfotransferase [Ignavibacteriota bacterium]MCW5886334.1 aryl-sulfate sulfotransferase [Candidatus Kapabacteria bacterium]